MITETVSAPPARTTSVHVLRWLDEGEESHGERYRELRRRLVAYFDRKDCEDPEDLADETFLRIACTLEGGRSPAASSPAQHCYEVARLILLETIDHGPAVGFGRQMPADDAGDVAGVRSVERRLQALPADQRALVVEYYGHPRERRDERRRQMATRMGHTPASLARLAAGIRARLESAD